MKIRNYLGIDIGTSGCKAAVFDAAGSQIALAAQEYDVIFSDDGGAELNSDEVIEKCFRDEFGQPELRERQPTGLEQMKK